MYFPPSIPLPKSAPGAPFYIRTNHEKLLGLIVLNLRNIFLQSCFRVSSSRTVPLRDQAAVQHIQKITQILEQVEDHLEECYSYNLIQNR